MDFLDLRIIRLNGINVGVSNDGKIYDIKTMKERYQRIKGHGYCYVSVNRKEYCVHRLVAYAYGILDDIEFDRHWHIDHKNDDPKDNRLSNLQLLSASENRKKECEKHRKELPYEYVLYREKTICEEVIRLPSVLAVARYLGVDKSFVSQVVKGKRPRCKGMVVRKVEKEK